MKNLLINAIFAGLIVKNKKIKNKTKKNDSQRCVFYFPNQTNILGYLLRDYKYLFLKL